MDTGYNINYCSASIARFLSYTTTAVRAASSSLGHHPGGSGGGELGVGFGFRMCFTVLDPTIGLYTTFDGKGFVECVRQT